MKNIEKKTKTHPFRRWPVVFSGVFRQNISSESTTVNISFPILNISSNYVFVRCFRYKIIRKEKKKNLYLLKVTPVFTPEVLFSINYY